MQHVAQSIYRYAFLQSYLPFFSKKVSTLTDLSQTRVLKIIFYNIILSQTIDFKKIFKK